MSDLISRSALIKALEEDKKSICSLVYACVNPSDVDELEFELEYLIMCQQSFDAVPVVRGEWIEIEQPGWSRSGYNATARVKCSNCGKEALNYSNSYREHGGSVTECRWIESNFCPNCGADMRKKVN